MMSRKEDEGGQAQSGLLEEGKGPSLSWQRRRG